MKKWLLLSLLICCFLCVGWLQVVPINEPSSGGGVPSYSFYVEFEGTVDGTTYTLGGNDYSAGGTTTGTLNSDATITSWPPGSQGNCVEHVDDYDYIQFSVNTSDISNDEGTIEFDFYYTTWDSYARLFYAYYATGTDLIECMMDSTTGELRLRYYGGGSYTYITTSGMGLQANTSYHITCKWRAGSTDPSLYISGNGYSTSTDDDLPSMDGEISTLRVAGYGRGSQPATFYIDNFKVYTSWQ